MKFIYYGESEQPQFQCKLKAYRCRSMVKGRHCKKHTVLSSPYCWVHLLYQHHLRLLPSTVEGAGKGVFVIDKKQPVGTVVFKKGATICPYMGELINAQQLQDRYGDGNAPFVLEVSKDAFIDAACERSVGSMINHKPRRQANCEFVANRRDKTARLRATKNITNGQELFVSYGDDYDWDLGHYTTTR